MNRHLFFVAATSFAFVVSCGPTAGERGEPTASSSASAPGTGGSGSRSSSMSSRRGSSLPPVSMGGPGLPCDICASALGGGQSSTLCGPSQTAFDAILACACTTACATVCGNGAVGNCLDAWAGNPPLECKTCLVSPTGCGASWDACISDDGVTPPGSGSTSAGSGGGSCTCQTTAQLCPGGGSCATPGPFDGPGNDACGSAEYCAPCCDPGDACATQGACKMTLVDQAPCSMDYECCSGVCAAGKCDGGCGILISF